LVYMRTLFAEEPAVCGRISQQSSCRIVGPG
jgi:hypothetical protein